MRAPHAEPPPLDARAIVRRGERDAVLLKPAGLSCEAPQRGGAPVRTLLVQARALLDWPQAQLPHRLDRPTRGFVVVARDAAAVAAHNAAIREGRWTKHYLARIAPRGGLDPRSLLGPQRAYLRREGERALVVRSGGDPSRLTVQAIAPAPGHPGQWHALVLLETGRYHQIRAMLAHLGAPLVGDALYGGAAGTMYLDHASLWMPDLGSGAPVRVYIPEDAGREPLDPSVAAALASATARAPEAG